MAIPATVRLMNVSRQTIRFQVRPVGGDFFRDEQQVALRPGHTVLLFRDHLLPEQVVNLTKRGFVREIYHSE